jgi:hypothetical protein
MARPKRDTQLDLGKSIELTAGAIEHLTCRTDVKTQAFLRDNVAPGLRVRVTNTGAKAFVFEAKLNRQTIRRTIGDVRAWTIEAARKEANRLRVTLDNGTDPRELERQQATEKASRQEREQSEHEARTLSAATAWNVYCEARRPFWGERHHADHLALAKAGGRLRHAALMDGV